MNSVLKLIPINKAKEINKISIVGALSLLYPKDIAKTKPSGAKAAI
jgi:hypothetical protein